MKKEEIEKQLARLFSEIAVIFTLPNVEKIYSFLEKLFATVPGVSSYDICIRDPEKPSRGTLHSRYLGPLSIKKHFNPKAFSQLRNQAEEKGGMFFSIRTADSYYGFIILKVEDKEIFKHFDYIINNFAIFISTILENLENKQILHKHEVELEKLVEERSASLLTAKRKLEKMLVRTIQALSYTVEQRDPYTAGHQHRVATLSKAIAQELNLKPDVIQEIYLGAMIHDIGKITVPAEILSSPVKLSDLQFNLLKTHVIVGYNIAQSIPLPKIICDIILHHHERLNGSGYPDQLKGNRIRIETRIVTVADVFEAMSSHRPYRAARSLEETLDELEKGAGILYDPQVVAACKKIILIDQLKLPAPFL